MNVGVIIGRFQVPDLTPAHQELIRKVEQENDRILILIGQSDTRSSKRYPLDYKAVETMLREKFPKADFDIIEDHESDEYWSAQVDKRIEFFLLTAGDVEKNVNLYGGRDSFIPFYKGKYPVREIIDLGVELLSGTEMRASVQYPTTKEGRAGAIWSSQYRWPTMYQVVDAAILNEKGEVLLCKKEGSNVWQLVGGFVDPRDEDLEMAVRREVKEETGLDIRPDYQFSLKIDDKRYSKENDKVMSHVFLCTIAGNCFPKAADDIVETKFFDRLDLPPIIDTHKKMMQMLGMNTKERA